MFLPVAAAIVGALAMGSTKPRTSYEKKRAMGTRSGITYEVEEFVQAGFVVVRAPDGTEAVLSRKVGAPGFQWSRGRGNAGTLKLIRNDFGVPETPPPPLGGRP